MDLQRVGREALEAIVSMLPSKSTPVAYVLRLGDGSLYISTSQHLSYRLAQIVRASEGQESTASKAIQRAGGWQRLEAFSVCRTEAGALKLAETWTEAARKRKERIATDALTGTNHEDAVRRALDIPESSDF